MSVIGSNILAGASGQGGGYNLTNSLRFRSSASAYLNRTPASASNRKTWTWSAWVKLGAIGTNPALFQSGFSSAPWTAILLQSNGTFEVTYTAGSSVGSVSSSVMRDPSAWYHFVWVTDTTQATASNRVKLYVNGVQQTFSSTNYPAQNTDTTINNTVAHTIGGWSGQYFDGYLTEVNFIDGQALTPSDFGETSATTGVWQPKKYAGTYGTNGFYLPFTNNSTTTTLGNDFSGNGNNWTTNNISLTAGATYDSMTDVPTLTSATASNFATFNPLVNSTGTYSATPTYSQANLLATGTADTKQYYSESTIYFSSGKFYSEFTPSAVTGNASYVGIGTENLYLYAPDGQYYNNGSWGAYGATYTTNDVIGVAVDATTGTIEFYKNGTSQGQKTIATGKTWVFRTSSYNTGASHSWTANFGQRPFAFSPPTGYVALNCYNLP